MSQIDSDAIEFGNHFKQGGWRLGLLVARNVHISNGERSRSDIAASKLGKLTANQFAEKSGVSARTVQLYYKAWELASNRSDGPCVTPPQLLKPGQDDTLSINELVEESDPDERLKALNKLWLSFYHKAKGKDEKPEPKPEPKPAEKTVEVAATEDDSDSNDDDSFVPIETQAELARKDKHNKIVESAESLERVADRFDQIGEVEEPDDIQAVQEIVAKAEAIAAKGRELLKLKAVPKAM